MSTEDRVQALNVALADTYVLYLRTQNYHWNVTGMSFASLHALFEQQYTTLAVAIDEIAERIRTLGARAPGSFEEFSQLTSLKSAPVQGGAKEMVNDLILAHEALIQTWKGVLRVAEGCPGTDSLACDQVSFHEKTLWMLTAVAS